MKKLILGICLYFFIVGCATGPINSREVFPSRNQDPRIGLIINQGTAHSNVFIYDEADRLIEQVYFSGASSYLEINGQNIPRYWIKKLEIGQYRVEIYPFYYKTSIITGRHRIDLPKQVSYIHVNRNPSDYYYNGRHWAWILYLNGGDIPNTVRGLPGINLQLQGEAWKLFQ